MSLHTYVLLWSLANVKFPEGTAAGLYKTAVAARPNYDILRVDQQKINWTLKELDVSDSYSLEPSILL